MQHQQQFGNRREAKRTGGKSAAEQAQIKTEALLRKYNDLKNLQDQEDIKSKMVILRRIAHKINWIRDDLYKYPILEFVQDTSKTLLLNELELLYWYHALKTFLKSVNGDPRFTYDSLRLFFYQCGFYVKRVLLVQMELRLAKYPSSKFLLSRVESESIVIASI
jgi:hypothetical protein